MNSLNVFEVTTQNNATSIAINEPAPERICFRFIAVSGSSWLKEKRAVSSLL